MLRLYLLIYSKSELVYRANFLPEYPLFEKTDKYIDFSFINEIKNNRTHNVFGYLLFSPVLR